MDFWTWLVQFADYLLYLAGLVGAIGVAASWVYKIIAAARKPHKELEEHVESLAKEHQHYDDCLKRDKQRLDEIEGDDKLILRALMQLIAHELDGNHVDKLAEVRDRIHDHLIEK